MSKNSGVDKAPLSADDICKILESSARNGVTKLTVRGLEASFHGGYTQEVAKPFAEESPRHEAVSLDAIQRDQELLVQERIANLMVEDPVEYEKLLLDGDLTDEQEA